MIFQRQPASWGRWLLLALVAPVLLPAQTTININNSVLQSTVRRFGINLGGQTFYDSGQMMKNLVFINPSFEGEIYQSTIRCGSGTSNSCTDENAYAGWQSSFWNNASYTMITGGATGRTGTVCAFNSNPGVVGGTFTFCDGGSVAPSQGDYMIVRTKQNGTLAWPSSWLNNVGAGSVTVESTDLPLGTTGQQSALFNAPSGADVAEASTFFDSTIGKTFLQLNGQYQLTFKAKGLSGSQAIAVGVTRAAAGLTYINQTVSLTNTWQPYTLTFNASETGSSIGRVEVSFATVGADSFQLDDLSLVQLNTDPTNTTVFRDPVVNTLKALHPGVIRFWFNQLGESLDNLLADPQGRQRSGYSAYDLYTDNFQTPFVTYGLAEFLQLCENVGAEPWVVMPITLSDAEASNLIDYLAGGTNTTYGAKRAAAGHPAPWTSSFKTIHLEFGNEAWNGDFKGGALEYPDGYGTRAQKIFGDMQSNASYVASSFDLIVNGQSASPGRNAGIQSYLNNNTSFSIAPYMMYTIDQYDPTNLFSSTFAEAEAFVTNSGTSEGLAGGYILQNQQAVLPKPIVTSEMNLSPKEGAITQAALNGYSSSVGGGIAVIDSMLQQLRAGVLTQNLFELPGYNFVRPDGSSTYLWGSVVDMGVTNRLRAQFLAEQLANNAIGNSTAMLQTQHTGFDPTWNQPQVNSVQLNNAHYLQSFAFTDGNGHYSMVLFNLSLSVPAPITFGGAILPTGTVNVQQLTSANITDTNEFSNLIATTSNTVANFVPSATMNLPSYSMTVLTWGAGTQGAPQITGVTATGVTATSATITWTTDQAASSQVQYGTTIGYGSTSPLNSTLVTSHSVTLMGLTPGTTYDYAAVSTNSSSASATSGNFTFQTAAQAPVISAVTATNISGSSATLTWTTDQPASSLVNYGTTTGYGSSSTPNTALVTSHSVTLTNLTPGSTYDYAVTSANSGGPTTSGNFSFQTTTQAPPMITGVTASSITSSSAVITWTTDQVSSSQVKYGTTSAYGFASSLNQTLVTSHSVMLSGLAAGTTYDYAAISANSGGGTATSANLSFVTSSAVTPPPAISAVTATNITPTSATITWTTDQASSSLVNYGMTTGYGSASTLNSTLVTSHSVMLSGLTAGTTYDYDVVSTNSGGNSNSSGNFSFATASNSGGSNSATYSGLDTTTQGAWTGSYGSDGDFIANYASNAPSYATVSLTGQSNWTFASSTTDVRALQTSAGSGIASAYYGSSFSINVNLTDGNAHRIALYLLDWDTTARAETISILDGVTHAVLNTQSFSSFQNGQYASWNIKGNVIIQVTMTAGQNAVVSGIFFGPAPVSTSSASYSGPDTTTQGTWTGSYGADGAMIDGGANTVPSYATVSLAGQNSWTFAPSTSDTRALQVSSGSSSRVAALYYGSSFTINLNLTDGNTHKISLYLLDWNTTSRAETISIMDASSHVVLSTQTFASFQNGEYASWNVKGNVVIQVTQTGGENAVLSGIFFGGASATQPVITGVTASSITSSSAVITWTTDQVSSSQVKYGTTSAYGFASSLNQTLVTSHSVMLSGLAAGTTYDYAAISANSGGGTATSANLSFVTSSAVTPPPAISAVTATNITPTSATITWTTDQASSSLVNYGMTTGYGSASTLNSTLVTSHSVMLSGLTAGTTYDYDVVSTNSGGNSNSSGNFSFATASNSGGSNSATYSGLDTTTQGAWTGSYGSDGDFIANYASNAPSYATVSLTGQSNWTFASSTTDVRALQTSAGSGIASAYYGSSFSINVNLTDGNAHRIALYLLDWDTTARAETISILDGVTHAVLNTQSFSSFQNGQYASWNIKGNVIIQVTMTAGQNAVVSGIFFGPAPVSTSSASYSGPDTTTQGTWTGSYGADGAMIDGGANTVPSYATVSLAGQNSWTFAPSTSDTRALQVSSGSSSRVAALYYGSSFTINLNLTDGNTHKISLYLLDWNTTSRAETISIMDASSHVVLSTQTFASFQNGEYASWNVKGNVVIQVTQTGGENAVLSGIFFGGASATPPATTATYAGLDTTTQGAWATNYGADGYFIANYANNYPAYATVSQSGQSTWTWISSTSDARALQIGSGTGIASTDYSTSSFSVNVKFNDGVSHKVALYLLDWDTTGRTETISVLDATSHAVLSTQMFSGFHNGEYASWNIKGNVIIQVTATGGQNAVVSGIFFGAAAHPSAVQGGSDTTIFPN